MSAFPHRYRISYSIHSCCLEDILARNLIGCCLISKFTISKCFTLLYFTLRQLRLRQQRYKATPNFIPLHYNNFYLPITEPTTQSQINPTIKTKLPQYNYNVFNRQYQPWQLRQPPQGGSVRNREERRSSQSRGRIR